MEKILEEGVDLTFNDPTLMQVQSCMAARYDAGVVAHRKEHTGVIEVRKVDMRYGRNTIIEQSRAEQSRAEQLDVCVRQWENIMPGKNRDNTNQGRVYDSNGIYPALNTMEGGGRQPHIVEHKKIKVRQATKDGFIECEIGGIVDLDYPTSQTIRGRVIRGGTSHPP